MNEWVKFQCKSGSMFRANQQWLILAIIKRGFSATNCRSPDFYEQQLRNKPARSRPANGLRLSAKEPTSRPERDMLRQIQDQVGHSYNRPAAYHSIVTMQAYNTVRRHRRMGK